MRGNTTAKQSKKPFKLKFDKKQKPFGLKKDKTWVLLANFNDRSFVRSFAGLDLGDRLDGLDWTSKGVFTEVVVNGSYRGSYQLIQSIKIDGDRVDINEETGQIIEFDPWWREDGVPGMEGKGVYAAPRLLLEGPRRVQVRGRWFRRPRGLDQDEDLGHEEEDQELRGRALRQERDHGLGQEEKLEDRTARRVPRRIG